MRRKTAGEYNCERNVFNPHQRNNLLTHPSCVKQFDRRAQLFVDAAQNDERSEECA